MDEQQWHDVSWQCDIELPVTNAESGPGCQSPTATILPLQTVFPDEEGSGRVEQQIPDDLVEIATESPATSTKSDRPESDIEMRGLESERPERRTYLISSQYEKEEALLLHSLLDRLPSPTSPQFGSVERRTYEYPWTTQRCKLRLYNSSWSWHPRGSARSPRVNGCDS